MTDSQRSVGVLPAPVVQEAMTDVGFRVGMAERDAIVKWLRSHPSTTTGRALHAAANRIEKGAHHDIGQ